jgi:diguanylate cyclase (GGDEF)-like protein
MQHPYVSFLEKLNLATEWVTSLEEACENDRTAPLAVVVDIDPLSRPLEPHLEKLRFHFPHSDLIALSGTDSASTALLVIRSGFSDFLLKPISPEELLWSIKKVIQKRELFQKLEDPEANVVRALTQISSCSTPSLIRLSTLEFLQSFFKGQASAWISLKQSDNPVLCAYPKGMDDGTIQKKLSEINISVAAPPLVTWSSPEKNRNVLLTCLEGTQAVLIWGIQDKVEEEKLSTAKTLVEHSELSLLNLEKFEEIKHLSFTDELTGLFNSRYLKYALTNTINRAKNKNRNFAVLFIDVDHFKSINTQHGHLVGSDFLIAIGKSIRNSVREQDTVFRYGGDEFVVILSDSQIEGAQMIAERIRLGVERRLFSIHGLKLQTTVSIGVAMFPEHAKSQEELLKLADSAMYSAKETSRNSVHIYETRREEKSLQKRAS